MSWRSGQLQTFMSVISVCVFEAKSVQILNQGGGANIKSGPNRGPAPPAMCVFSTSQTVAWQRG